MKQRALSVIVWLNCQDNATCYTAQILSIWFLERANMNSTVIRSLPNMVPLDVVEPEICITDVLPADMQQVCDAVVYPEVKLY